MMNRNPLLTSRPSPIRGDHRRKPALVLGCDMMKLLSDEITIYDDDGRDIAHIRLNRSAPGACIETETGPGFNGNDPMHVKRFFRSFLTVFGTAIIKEHQTHRKKKIHILPSTDASQISAGAILYVYGALDMLKISRNNRFFQRKSGLFGKMAGFPFKPSATERCDYEKWGDALVDWMEDGNEMVLQRDSGRVSKSCAGPHSHRLQERELE